MDRENNRLSNQQLLVYLGSEHNQSLDLIAFGDLLRLRPHVTACGLSKSQNASRAILWWLLVFNKNQEVTLKRLRLAYYSLKWPHMMFWSCLWDFQGVILGSCICGKANLLDPWIKRLHLYYIKKCVWVHCTFLCTVIERIKILWDISTIDCVKPWHRLCQSWHRLCQALDCLSPLSGTVPTLKRLKSIHFAFHLHYVTTLTKKLSGSFQNKMFQLQSLTKTVCSVSIRMAEQKIQCYFE